MPFEDDFARGEQEAARLVARMRASLNRAEEFERAAARDAKLQRRLADSAARESRSFYRPTGRGPAGALPPPGGTGGGRFYPPPYYYEGRGLPPGPAPPLQIGAGRQPLGLPRPGETVGGTQYSERAAQGYEKAARGAKDYAKAQEGMGRQDAKFRRGLSETLLIQGQANNQYRRFGALSAEWIGAASRGATTIQELGRQTAVTIGKFGGWLVAGSLLFTALGAVRAIGQGAIDSASGVNQLQRVVNNVDPDAAQRGFRERAEFFNLPISDVAGAAYEMGKIFHDQNEALEATDAILYSVKVGELEYADAARYLTAITRGFNLEAKDTGLVFDQINQAQNRLGVSIRDTEAGIAKSAGTIAAAGSGGLAGLTKLLALTSVAQKATGRTGEEIGTAFARAPKFLRREEAQESLRNFGIDPKQPILDLIEEAIKVAEGLGGEKRQQLAEAIFGPLRGASVGTPLLGRGFAEYKKALTEVDPKQAAGSGQEELNRLLGSMEELISKIGTDLQVLGSNLAEAGFLDIFGAGVKLLDQMLVAVNNLLELFNNLPTPIRKSLAILAEVYALVSLLRRFNLGDSFAPGSLGQRVFTSPKQFQRLYREDLGGQLDTLIGERERTTATASRAAIGLNAAQAQKVQAEAEYQRLTTVHGAESQQALAQKQNVLRSQAAINAAEERKLAAELAELEILGAQKVVEDKKAALAIARNEAEARALAARYGDRVSTSFDRPLTGEEAARARGYQIQTDQRGGFAFAPLAAGGAPGPADIAQETKRTSQLRQRLRLTGTAWQNLATTQVALLNPLRNQGRFITTYGAATDRTRQAMTLTGRSARQVGGRVLPAAGAAIARGAGALRGLASAGYAFIGGPIGLLLAGAYAAFEFGDDLGRAVAGGQDQIDRINKFLENTPEGTKQFRERLDLYSELRDEQLEALIGGFGDFEAEGAGGFSAQRALEARRLLETRRAAKRRGDKVKSVPETLRAAGLISDQEAKERAEDEGPEYEEQIERLELESKIRQARLGTDKVGVAREGLRSAQRVLGILKKEGVTGKKRREAVLGVIEARNALQEEVKQQAQELVEASVSLAVARAGDNPVRQARAELQGARRKAKLAEGKAEEKSALADIINARRALRDAIREQAEELAEANANLAEARAGGDPIASAEAQLRSAEVGLRFARTKIERRNALADVINARREVEEAVRDQARELAEADISITEARAGGDPVLEAKAEIERAQVSVRFAETEAERREGLAELIRAEDQLDQAYADIALARIGLRIASTEDPVRQATLRVRQTQVEAENASGLQARLEAQARRREAVRSRRDAVAQKRIENVEFDADLERITTAQEIARYENILKTANLGRETKRTLLRRIHDLNKELEGDTGDFELNVGNIRLPTIYDIRRAVGGGANQQPTIVYNDNSNNQLSATVDGGNPDEVMTLMSNTFNRHNRNARRSAGLVPRG